jgi:hypothetical protein
MIACTERRPAAPTNGKTGEGKTGEGRKSMPGYAA